MGISGGRPKTVTPPISIPVKPRVSSAFAKDSREAPNKRFTTWFTFNLTEACTRHAQYTFSPRVDVTTIVLALVSNGYPYSRQNSAVSANAGSHGMISWVIINETKASATLECGWFMGVQNQLLTVMGLSVRTAARLSTQSNHIARRSLGSQVV